MAAKVESMTKDVFLAFLKKAIADGKSEERQTLYLYMVEGFMKGDVDYDGAVDPVEFDQMIESSVIAPRRLGLAPTTHELFPSPEARLAERRKIFTSMDENNDGKISLDEWIGFCMKHIEEKMKAHK